MGCTFACTNEIKHNKVINICIKCMQYSIIKKSINFHDDIINIIWNYYNEFQNKIIYEIPDNHCRRLSKNILDISKQGIRISFCFDNVIKFIYIKRNELCNNENCVITFNGHAKLNKLNFNLVADGHIRAYNVSRLVNDTSKYTTNFPDGYCVAHALNQLYIWNLSDTSCKIIKTNYVAYKILLIFEYIIIHCYAKIMIYDAVKCKEICKIDLQHIEQILMFNNNSFVIKTTNNIFIWNIKENTIAYKYLSDEILLYCIILQCNNKIICVGKNKMHILNITNNTNTCVNYKTNFVNDFDKFKHNVFFDDELYLLTQKTFDLKLRHYVPQPTKDQKKLFVDMNLPYNSCILCNIIPFNHLMINSQSDSLQIIV
jgi:hypothetical protein